MSKKTFNPTDWLAPTPTQSSQSQKSLQSFCSNNDIEEITNHTPSVQPQQRLLQALPPEFDRKAYLAIAKTLNIPDKTAEKQSERYLQGKLIERISHGTYRKK